MTILKFSGELAECDPQKTPVTIIGQKNFLSELSFNVIEPKLAPRVSEEVFKQVVSNLRVSTADSLSLYLDTATVVGLPKLCSRHNTPSHSHALTKLIKDHSSGNDEYIVIICEYKNIFASACAVARAFPLFSRKTTFSSASAINAAITTIEFIVVNEKGQKVAPLSNSDVLCLTTAAEGIRLTARIVDAPCSEMNTDAFIQEIANIGDVLNIKPEIIRGKDLAKRGFGGIYSVGQAAVHPPALVVLSHVVPNGNESIAWIGKGIVYDTGGLSIKSKTGMPGMKRDCGGAAAVLGAFYTAVKMGFQDTLHAIFCLAENAVGPKSIRPDDIVTLYSGKTVEINNCDAEGRLVLADGIAYAEKDLNCNTILDIATLTGAQGIATGKYHAAVLTNNEVWEVGTVKAGRISGDLVHPVPYTPELHFQEYSSCVADFKNSVADRGNAQVSCAGLFIAAQIGFNFEGYWIHVDMACPAYCGERATGYGVALLVVLFGRLSENGMLQAISPLIEIADENEIENARKKIRVE